jgi:hypothetical protein
MNRYLLTLLAFMAGAAMPTLAETVIHTKDGRALRVAVNADEIARIEFVASPTPPPLPPPPPPTPKAPTAAVPAFLQTLLSGHERAGEAWGNSGGRWKFTLKIASFDRATGGIVGQIAWPSLSSVHRIRGKLTGDKLTFSEVEAIRAGGAHLNVAYTFTIGKSSADGTWVDNGDKSRGGAKFE